MLVALVPTVGGGVDDPGCDPDDPEAEPDEHCDDTSGDADDGAEPDPEGDGGSGEADEVGADAGADPGDDVADADDGADDDGADDGDADVGDAAGDDGDGDGADGDGDAPDPSGGLIDDRSGESPADEPNDDEPAGDPGASPDERDEPADDADEADDGADADGTEDDPGDEPIAVDEPSVDDEPAPGDLPAVVPDDRPKPDPAGGGLRATQYDGVYARGVPVWVAMTATRLLESGGDYRAEARGSSASGAYQVIDSTWNGYGGFARASDAPPAVQDQFAHDSMVAILKRFGNDVSAIPIAWYYPAALRDPALMDVVPVPSAGNVLTPREYQARWMQLFHEHLAAGSPVFLPADPDPLTPSIAFPVLGPTSFWDDWHAPRDGGARRHEGLDFMGENGQPLRAAFDGVVTRVRPDDLGKAGVGITITRDDGLRANYFHLDAELRWHPGLEIGDRVRAGQVIAYMGTTGNAGVPHLHFELRTPEGEPIAPYPSTLAAVQREQCSVGIGPWSTMFRSPDQLAVEISDAPAVDDDDDADAADAEVEVAWREIHGPDGARWTVSTDGAVTAEGWGAVIAPTQGDCVSIPDGEFGTDAGGLPLDQLPAEWWGDEVEPDDLAAMIAAVRGERSEEFEPDPLDRSPSLVRLRIGDRGILTGLAGITDLVDTTDIAFRSWLVDGVPRLAR